MTKTCSIPQCGKPHEAKGYCNAHYKRLTRHGDPLAGGAPLTPKGEAQRFYHEVVLRYDGEGCLHWPHTKDSKGYGQLWCDGVYKLVHRLVCEAVNGPAPSPTHEAAHSCGNGHEGCCSPRHLKWKTSAENKADMLIHGTHSRGERHGSAKLNREQVLEIRALRGIEPGHSIADMFGVSPSTVSKIQAGRKWVWL